MQAIKFVSTRGHASIATAGEAALRGLAPDGGLYMPDRWPQVAQELGRDMSYPELVAANAAPFLAGRITPDRLRQIASHAYEHFPLDDPIPLRMVEENIALAELFHGPTCAFKDFALQFIGGLYEELIGQSGRPLLVVGATTGDTGPATIAALEGRQELAVAMLHPHERISQIQRRQMTCTDASNVLNIAVKGSFDDCQAIVKRLLREPDAGKGPRLTTPNSINIFRIISQCAYYFWITRKFDGPVTFAVPSGNFGNAFSGYAARRMGAPIGGIVIGTNRNDVLYRALATGEYKPDRVHPTISPAMDITVASNFERLLFSLAGNDAHQIRGLFNDLDRDGAFDIPAAVLDKMRRQFSAVRVSEQETRRAIRQLYETHDLIVDPHTAIGFQSAIAVRPKVTGPIAVFATAHPAKFPEALRETLAIDPPVPAAIAALEGCEEDFSIVEADFTAVKALISNRSKLWR